MFILNFSFWCFFLLIYKIHDIAGELLSWKFGVLKPLMESVLNPIQIGVSILCYRSLIPWKRSSMSLLQFLCLLEKPNQGILFFCLSLNFLFVSVELSSFLLICEKENFMGKEASREAQMHL